MLANLALAEGSIFFDFFDPSTEDFKKRFQSRFKRMPMPGAARAYDVVNAIRRAALKCGTSSDQIRDCLRQVAFVGDSGPFEFDIERNFKVTATPSRLYEVRNGKITSLE